MKKLNSPWLAAIVLAAFLALCWHCYPRHTVDREGYPAADIRALQHLIDKSVKEPRAMKYRKQLAELFNTKPEEESHGH